MKTRTIFLAASCAVLAVFVAAAFAEDVELPPTSVSWYLWSNDGKVAGYFHAGRTLTDSVDTPVALANDFQIQWRGKQLSLKTWTYCRGDECLSPVKIVSEGKGDDEFGTFTATIAREAKGPSAGKLTATLNGRKIEMDIPERTATDFALFWIVRTRPFDKEKVFEFNCLEAGELNLKKGQKLTYVGEEEIPIDGAKVKLHKFEQTGGGITLCYYWVNDKHELVRVLMDGRKEFLLTTKEKALSRAGEPEQ